MSYFVYFLTNKSGTLYIGVTNDLERWLFEHLNKLVQGFTADYNIDRLVYFEESPSINDAIARGKQLKKWSRIKKRALIEAVNPGWVDLSPEITRQARDDAKDLVGGGKSVD